MSDNQISITDTDELLGIMPTLLGYHPTHSIVILGLAGHPQRVDSILRGDYPTPGRLPTALTQAARILTDRAQAAIVVLYHPRADQVALDPLLRRFRIPVLAIVTVTDPHPQPLHPGGWANAVLTGRRILPTRADVISSIVHHPEIGAPHDLNARLAPFTDPATRDRFVQLHSDDPGMVADLIELAQHAPDTDPRTADLCSALALLAYRNFDSTLANAAIDRALHVDPAHRLARLVQRVSQAGIHPDELAVTLHTPLPD